ncbi:MAG: hypothetical protein F9K46_05610 [Anaerolineae bacterium]|nr:MAG: hypothetical protein F9K46_05610 [Anaerolineae bacterium]
MKRLLITFLAILCALSNLPTADLAHAEPSRTLNPCDFPSGPFAGQTIFVRQNEVIGELSLVSYNTGETVQIIESGPNTPQYDMRGWSSDCRYLIATMGVWGEQTTIAWDVVENRRVGTIATQGQQYGYLNWSPAHDYRLLVESLSGAWLWHLPSNSQALLTLYSDSRGNNFALHGLSSRSWDLTRNQLLVVTLDPTRDGVTAYDIGSGQEVAFYGIAPPTDILVQFRLFDDGRHVLVFANNNPISELNQLIMFGRATGSALPLAGHVLSSVNPSAIFSTTGRYLIVKTWELYVWDLQNLDANIPHRPTQTLEIYLGSSFGSRIKGFRTNADETRVQADIPWYGLDFTIWQWDMATGERFYAKRFFETVCDDLSQLAPEEDVEMVMWACNYQ